MLPAQIETDEGCTYFLLEIPSREGFPYFNEDIVKIGITK